VFWRRKQEDSGPRCPLCNSDVDESDAECPLCFYELDRSPRHQSLNITTGEEDTLIDMLDSENEPEVEESVLEAEDVIDLSAQDPIVQITQDDSDFISIPADQAPSFVSSRMVPTGVSEAEVVPEPVSLEEQEEAFDLGGIEIPAPPESSDIEYEEVPVSEEAMDHPAPEELDDLEGEDVADGDAVASDQPAAEEVEASHPPPAPAVVELSGADDVSAPETTDEVIAAPPPPVPPTPLPPPPMPMLPPLDLPSPYLAPPPPMALPAKHNGNLTEGSMWPWPGEEQWDARDLRRELLEAMAAAKAGQDAKAGDILDRIGPHLGDNIDLLFHVGVLLKRLGREYELVQLLLKAQARHPDNLDVSNAASRLG